MRGSRRRRRCRQCKRGATPARRASGQRSERRRDREETAWPPITPSPPKLPVSSEWIGKTSNNHPTPDATVMVRAHDGSTGLLGAPSRSTTECPEKAAEPNSARVPVAQSKTRAELSHRGDKLLELSVDESVRDRRVVADEPTVEPPEAGRALTVGLVIDDARACEARGRTRARGRSRRVRAAPRRTRCVPRAATRSARLGHRAPRRPAA